MIDQDLLKILACPETHQPLTEATAEVVAAANAKIEGGAKNRGGKDVEGGKLEAGLLRQDGKVVYPVRDGIPVLLIDEGIEL